MPREGLVQNFYFDSEVFGDYMQEQSCINPRIISSGIMVNDPMLSSISTSGNVGAIPFFDNGDEFTDALNFDGSTANTPIDLKGGKQVFMACGRMKAWKDSDFVRYLTGKSPLQNLASNLVVPFYTRQWENTLVSIMKGVLGVAALADHVTDLALKTGTIEDKNMIQLDTYLTAGQKALGDRRNQFSLFICHSVVATNLKKKELIEYRKYTDPVTLQSFDIPYYGNMVLIESDTNTVDTSNTLPIYESYMAGVGSFLTNTKDIPNPYYAEYDPETDGGVNKLYTKQARIIHPNGMSLKVNNIVAESPTNEELATSTNWELAFDHRLVALACIKSNG